MRPLSVLANVAPTVLEEIARRVREAHASFLAAPWEGISAVGRRKATEDVRRTLAATLDVFGREADDPELAETEVRSFFHDVACGDCGRPATSHGLQIPTPGDGCRLTWISVVRTALKVGDKAPAAHA